MPLDYITENVSACARVYACVGYMQDCVQFMRMQTSIIMIIQYHNYYFNFN